MPIESSAVAGSSTVPGTTADLPPAPVAARRIEGLYQYNELCCLEDDEEASGASVVQMSREEKLAYALEGKNLYICLPLLVSL